MSFYAGFLKITDNFARQVSKKCNDMRPFYDLYAVTAHTGQLGGGHYVAFAMNPNRQWYYYKDSQVCGTSP